MKKKLIMFLMLISISAMFCTNTFAASKSDIIGYVNSQTVCGDTGLFNSYKSTFTRLLRQKNLTEDELNTIYSYLQNSVGILNSKGVCKLSDLSKLTKTEKDTVYGNLTAGLAIIKNAPLIGFGEEESTTNNNTDKKTEDSEKGTNTNDQGTKVTINTQDGTMDIYENGVLVDKVSMSGTKMTYTGANVTHVMIVIAATLVFILALVPFIMLFKKHTAKTRLIKNILVSLMICSVVLGGTIAIFGRKIDALIAMIDLISFSNNNTQIKVEINEDKSIKTYPSYGFKYAKLKIPSVNIENDVYFGDTTSILALGIGHSSWSNLPTEGGVVVYSGHNKKEMLNGLNSINKGDKIIVDTDYAKCTYEVRKIEILKDYEIDKLTSIENKETLVIYTCYPLDSYIYTNERLVVYSTLIDTNWK